MEFNSIDLFFIRFYLFLFCVVSAEWYWKCFLRRYLCQGLAAILALMSVIVVWSELTFFNAEPVLSLFAIFVNLAKASYDYVSIEVNDSIKEKFFFFFSKCFFFFISFFQSPRLDTCACALIRQF